MISYAIATVADLMCHIPCPWQWSESARIDFAWIVSFEMLLEFALCVAIATLWCIKHAEEKKVQND